MYCILDLEVQNNRYLGQLASPFCPDNYIVAPGWAHDNGEVNYKYFNNQEEANASDWVVAALADQKVIVAHNATFEIHWLLHRHNKVFMQWLKDGGTIYCTQYAEYLLTHQTEQYPKLEDCSVKYGGTKKIDEVKLLWEQGVLTADIDPELIVQYLAGPSGDIVNTRTVFCHQHAAMLEQGMLPMFKERMDSLLFNAISTFNGLYVDREVAAKNHKAQLKRADEIRESINAMMPKDLPAEFEFNFGSDYHMSAFLFGGPVPYRHRVSYDPIKYEKEDCYEIITDGSTTYHPIESVDDFSNVTIYKSGKNKDTPKVFKVDSTTEKLKWGETYYRFKGLINFADLPSHVSELYTGRRAEFQGKRTLCDEITPVYSTGKDSLDVLANFVGFAKPLKELAQLDKDNGTYYITEVLNTDGTVKSVKGMLQFVGTDGIIHHQLNNCATITGRLSASTPNMQNIPREGTSIVKQMFSSRFGAAGRIVEVDYSALEVVHLAAASGDENLLAQLVAGTDMHCYRLAGALKEEYASVLDKATNRSSPDYKEYHQLRTDIKPKAFQFQYGASAHGISYGTGCSLEEAQEFIDTETALFPQTVAYRDVIRAEVERTGALPEGLHRESTDEGMWSIYRRGHYTAPGGTRYSFRQYAKRVNNQQTVDYKDTQLANYWQQGEASLIVQTACGRVIRWLIANDFFQGCVLPVNTVHDALYFDCINEEWAKYAGNVVQQIMSSTPAYMQEVMPAYAEWRYASTPWPAVAEQGANMMEKLPC